MTDKPAWVDGDALMEAMAAAVWEQCRTEGTSLVVDDPRNIAAVAASVARDQQPAGPGIGYEFRESLLVLLSRVQRGVQSTAEADLLRSHVEHLLTEHDRLAALNEPTPPTFTLLHHACGQLADIPGDVTLHPGRLSWPGHDCPADTPKEPTP